MSRSSTIRGPLFGHLIARLQVVPLTGHRLGHEVPGLQVGKVPHRSRGAGPVRPAQVACSVAPNRQGAIRTGHRKRRGQAPVPTILYRLSSCPCRIGSLCGTLASGLLGAAQASQSGRSGQVSASSPALCLFSTSRPSCLSRFWVLSFFRSARLIRDSCSAGEALDFPHSC